MPRVILAPALARWLSASPSVGGRDVSVTTSGTTVRDVLTSLFAVYPVLRGYVLDETGSMRHHVVAFVDGTPIRDKQTLNDPVPEAGEVYLFQALSGG